MRVLVAGGGGFLGGHLVRRLVDEGHEVRAVHILPLSECFQFSPDAENMQSDLSLLEGAPSATRVQDRVFNLAADSGNGFH